SCGSLLADAIQPARARVHAPAGRARHPLPRRLDPGQMTARDEAPSAGTRTNSGWLSAAEQRALAWLTPRTPLWLTPDRLTALGLGGAVLALAGYLLAAHYPVALLLVSVGL